MFPLLFALLGLIGIVLGCLTLRQCRRVAASNSKPPFWRFWRITVLVLGVLMGISQLDGIRCTPGYAVHTGQQEVTVVGVPFLVVVFDQNGNDFSSVIGSLVAMFGNAVFWFMVPHFFLSFYILRSSFRQSSQEASPASDGQPSD